MLSDKEFTKLSQLWAEAYLSFQRNPELCYLKLTEIGRIIGRHTKAFEERMGVGGTEVTAIIRRADGTIRKTQKYKFKGKKDKKGKPILVLKNKEIKDFPEE
ncbi:MAG: hypothetical protein HWN68_18145 [Desulfobacterales bacterium]|nr:hypothetical protein [Desulfobacterales bacterium]